MSAGRHARTRIRVTSGASATVLALATAASTLLPLSPARAGVPAAPTSAPALGGADRGGAVIVWLKAQHNNLNLRTHGDQRARAAFSDQAPVVRDITQHGGSDILQLVSVSAVAAHVSAAEVQRLQANPAVAKIEPDSTETVTIAASQTEPADDTGSLDERLCPADPSKPLQPEALSLIHASSADPAATDEGNSIATGKGVLVANDGINALAGNPNFVRSDGTHVVVDAPDYTRDNSDGEYYGDASSIAGQGSVVYDFATELPYSGLPAGCNFVLKGDAPDASLVDETSIVTPESQDPDSATESESQVVAGIDAAVRTEHADVLSESYGYSTTPGSYATHYAANDAAIAAGVTVVVSSGDSGPSGTVSSPATDPLAIAVGATNSLRQTSQAYGYAGWVNNDITPLSSGGTAPNNRVVDLVAPGYTGEAACSLAGTDCPTNTVTQAFGGTSESCPLVAGAAADVIQAYRDSHGGTSPTPAVVKQLLTSTATDLGAPADQQGAGLLDVYAAVKAAQQLPGSTAPNGTGDAPSLEVSPTQLDVSGDAGTSADSSVTVYNPDSSPATVTGSYRSLGAPTQVLSPVTENVSAPDPLLPVPAEGATAAAPVSFAVPAGLDRLTADMVWPDATHNNVLSFTLTDPAGRLRQISYDYGTPRSGGVGTVSNSQHVEVGHPEAGVWTAKILWSNGRGHLESLPNVPGTYTGSLSFQVSGQQYVTTAASDPVTIQPQSSVSIPLQVALPKDAGDHPESLQLSADNGALTSVPIARRSLVPTSSGAFTSLITSTVGRGTGGITTVDYAVAPGATQLSVTETTPETATDQTIRFAIVGPAGNVLSLANRVNPTLTPTVVNGVTVDQAHFTVPNPAAGVYEIDTILVLDVTGREFRQVVTGSISSSTTPIQITVPTPPAYGVTETLLGTGSASTNPVVFSIDATSPHTCTLSGPNNATITFTFPSHCVVDAFQAGDATTPGAAPAQVDLPIALAAQAISFNPPAGGTIGGTDALTATGGASGNPVTFSLDPSTTNNACSVSGSSVSYLHAGSCVVDADQAGIADEYAAAPTVTATISVGLLPQVVAFVSTAPTGVHVGDSYNPSTSGGASGQPVILSIDASTTNGACSLDGSGTIVSFVHAGTCVIDADQAGTADYAQAQTAMQEVSVGKLAQAVNFTTTAPANPKVGSTYIPAAAGGPSGNTPSITIDATTTNAACTISIAGVVTFAHPGVCVIDADLAGNADYEAAPTVQQSLAVVGTVQTIQLTSSAPAGRTVGETYTPTATASPSGLPVTFSVDPATTNHACTVTAGKVAFAHVGLCVVDADQAGNGDFLAATTVLQSIAVGREQTSASVAVGLTTVTATVSAVSPGTVQPTGNVNFYVNGGWVGTTSLVNGKAVLNYKVNTGASKTVSATYPGYADFGPSSASTSRSDPSITATVTSATAKTSYGWYRSAVTVTFTCVPKGAPLTKACPAAVTLSNNGAGQSVSQTITATDGGAATVSVSPINIDRTAPTLTVAGVVSGHSYTQSPHVTIASSDALSGVASQGITLSSYTSSGVQHFSYTATATDRAGNVTVVTGTYTVT